MALKLLALAEKIQIDHSAEEFFKANLAPTEFFVPTQSWHPAQLTPRRCVGANSRLASFKKLPSGRQNVFFPYILAVIFSMYVYEFAYQDSILRLFVTYKASAVKFYNTCSQVHYQYKIYFLLGPVH
jgi:hypothetical protein